MGERQARQRAAPASNGESQQAGNEEEAESCSEGKGVEMFRYNVAAHRPRAGEAF
jgi:hypothetical protein